MEVYLPKPNRSPGAVDAMGAIGLVGLAVGRFVPIAKLVPFWGCSFRRMTDIPCPGCGLTRVVDRFTHFDFLGALRANPLGTVAAAFFAACVVATVMHLGFGVPLPELLLTDKEWRRVRWAGVAAVVLNYAFVIFAWRVLRFT